MSSYNFSKFGIFEKMFTLMVPVVSIRSKENTFPSENTRMKVLQTTFPWIDDVLQI